MLLSFGFGWLGNALMRIRRQRSIVAMIEAAGGSVTFEHERYGKSPPGSRVARRLLGQDAFARVIHVKLVQGLGEESYVSDADLRLIAELSTIKACDLRTRATLRRHG